jgi:hypothetical protein
MTRFHAWDKNTALRILHSETYQYPKSDGQSGSAALQADIKGQPMFTIQVHRGLRRSSSSSPNRPNHEDDSDGRSLDVSYIHQVSQRAINFGRCPKIGTSQSAVTRQIAALENHLGVRLPQITTRSLVLTEDGRELLAHANRVLDAVEEAETWVGRRDKAPAGLVRIGVINALAQIYLLPKLPELLSRYPELSIEFVDSDGYQDLVSEGLDLSIRLGDVAASTLITRSLSHSPRVAVATVEYLRRAGEAASKCPSGKLSNL